MPLKIVVPELGESLVEATVGRWHKNEGERVAVGDVLVELETEKVDLEVGAERDGVLARIEKEEGEDVRIGEVLGWIEEAAGDGKPAAQAPAAKARPDVGAPRTTRAERHGEPVQPASPKPTATPLARRVAEERGVDITKVLPTDPSGRVRQRDVETYLEQPASPAAPTAATSAPQPESPQAVGAGLVPARSDRSPSADGLRQPGEMPGERREERIRMSRRRQTIARRLVEAQHAAAMLTTFNEIDMTAVSELRDRRKAAFKERHGVNLGITSFFVKAVVSALKHFPRLNAEIQGDEMVLKHYYDIGVAVGAEEGLVVPVLRDADQMSFAEIELSIKAFAKKAADRTLTLDDLRGGTFTITNGGVYGSLMSTPILNPPQVGILGLHKIEARPVSHAGQIAIRPMMYVALSYDHRLVDGMEAVQFLVRIKELVEHPEDLLLED
jgi:2-oxoglutarate dehydrogenase E2 component (dihydrolipoamide succinyltransferase)